MAVRRGRAVRRTALIAAAGVVFAGVTTPSAAVADPGCLPMGTAGTPEVAVDESDAGLATFALATVPPGPVGPHAESTLTGVTGTVQLTSR
ncbi:hypothetical protein [Nocardia sp. NPDC060249]|uniref:hypothetical protein n=1 Tax=Nocardia sp. NPDC060249 TaxID=3347082 RepID=UPI003646757F